MGRHISILILISSDDIAPSNFCIPKHPPSPARPIAVRLHMRTTPAGSTFGFWKGRTDPWRPSCFGALERSPAARHFTPHAIVTRVERKTHAAPTGTMGVGVLVAVCLVLSAWPR